MSTYLIIPNREFELIIIFQIAFSAEYYNIISFFTYIILYNDIIIES